MSWVSKGLGFDARRNALKDARAGLDKQLTEEESGTGFKDAFNQTAGSFFNQQMPKFRQSLQLDRESNIRRGIGTGDLGTSNEGDLTSAFQQNLANALGGLASSGYENSRNRILDIISGKVGSAQDELDSQMNLWGGLFKGGLQAAGSIWGAKG